MPQQIIVDLPEEDRIRNHIPEWVYSLIYFGYEVYIKDEATGELIQVLDLTIEDDTQAVTGR